MQNNELYHFGVLGMRWGVHRALKPSEGISRKEVKQYVHDYNKIHGTNVKLKNAVITKGRYTYDSKGHRLKIADVKDKNNSDEKKKTEEKPEMDLKTLQDSVTRLNLEKRYKELTTPELTQGQKLANTCKDILLSSAKDAASNYTKKIMNDAVGALYDNAKKEIVGGSKDKK